MAAGASAISRLTGCLFAQAEQLKVNQSANTSTPPCVATQVRRHSSTYGGKLARSRAKPQGRRGRDYDNPQHYEDPGTFHTLLRRQLARRLRDGRGA